MKFVTVMPFAKAFDDVYAAVKQTVENSGQPNATCIRVDEDLQGGHIMNKIDQHLRLADICIADITNFNHNVMWEVGFIEAIHKPLIAISQTSDPLPFNIRDLGVIRYDLDRLGTSLRIPLAQAIQQTLPAVASRRARMTIAVIGSRGASSLKAAYVIRTLATPFLSLDTTWYCGTNGAAEEAAARFLLEERQNVTAVYGNTVNVSPKIQALFAHYKAPITNIDGITISRRYPGLNSRDAFLVDNSDLFILISESNKQTTNTSFLHDWLSENGKDHLLGFA